MSSVRLVVIVAEAEHAGVIWCNRLAVRQEDWTALERTGMREVWIEQTKDALLRGGVPEGAVISLHLVTETFPIDNDEKDG
jgi:hypothetical protein